MNDQSLGTLLQPTTELCLSAHKIHVAEIDNCFYITSLLVFSTRLEYIGLFWTMVAGFGKECRM